MLNPATKTIKTALAFALACVLALGVAATWTAAQPAQAHAATISLSAKSKTVMTKATYTLKLKGAKASAVKWKTSNKAVATVGSTGKVYAKKAGTTTITATYKKRSYKCKITVKDPVVRLYLDTSLYMLGYYRYDYTYVYCNFHDDGCSGVKYYSSNPAVATIDSYGEVKAKSCGTTTITAKVHGKSVSKKVTVRNPSISVGELGALYLGIDTYDYESGDTFAPCVGYCPMDGGYDSCDEMAFSSSNPAVASVDGDGYLKLKSEGATTITVKAHGLTATKEIQVKRPAVFTEVDSTMLLGNEERLNATCEVHGGDCDEMVFSSSNTRIATITEYGELITKSAGQVTITARAHGAKASVVVDVVPPQIELSQDELVLSLAEDRYREYGLDAFCELKQGGECWGGKWTSSNTAVVTVSEYGSLTLKGVGEADVTYSYHGAQATCHVVVEA